MATASGAAWVGALRPCSGQGGTRFPHGQEPLDFPLCPGLKGHKSLGVNKPSAERKAPGEADNERAISRRGGGGDHAAGRG